MPWVYANHATITGQNILTLRPVMKLQTKELQEEESIRVITIKKSKPQENSLISVHHCTHL